MDTIVENVSRYYLSTAEKMLKILKEEKETIPPKLEAALLKFLENVRRDAVIGLNRPHWLMSRRMTTKMKSYKDGDKIWGIVGPAREEFGPNDPAEYWKKHDNPWFTRYRKPSAPPRFMKTAMLRHVGELEKDVQKAYAEIGRVYRRTRH